MACPAGYTFDESRPCPKAMYTDRTETLKPGDHLSTWLGDVTWTEYHLSAGQMEYLRFMSDPLADKALEALKIKPTQNALGAITAYVSRPVEEQESDAPRMLIEKMMHVPEWVDWKKIHRGQEVVWRYMYFIGYIYVHYSFVSAYALPRMAKVFTSTGYLNGPKTQQRIFETAQFVFEFMDSVANMQPRTGACWKSILQIRLLHAGVRARLTRISRAHSRFYYVEDLGVPINQEDMLGTVAILTSTVWRVLEQKFKIVMTGQEKEDYLHLWRYIGYLMGIDEPLLEKFIASPAKVDAFQMSTTLHLTDPDEAGGRLVYSVCQGLALPPGGLLGKVVQPAIKMGLMPNLLTLNLALCENVLGQEFWQLCKLPKTPFRYQILLGMMVGLIRVDLWMVDGPRFWRDRIRRPLLRQVLIFLLDWNLGKGWCDFEMRELPKGEKEGEGGEEKVNRGEVVSKMKWSSFGEDMWPQVLQVTMVVALSAALVMWTIS